MSFIVALLGLLVLILLVTNSPGSADGGYLVKNKTSDYCIVLPTDADPAESNAAAELAEYIQLMTGVKIPVGSIESSSKSNRIYIGRNHSLPSSLSKYTDIQLAPEEILMDTAEDGSVLLCGGSPRGTLYAVYEYLHRLGVRFYTPEYTKYLTNLNNIAGPRYFRFRPPARTRTLALGNRMPADWFAHNRMNSIALWGNLPAEYGYGMPEGPTMHTFRIFAKAGIFIDHPEWAPMLNGKRLPPVGNHNWGMCLNPEARAFLVQRAIRWSRSNSQYPIVWMAQNDASPYCECEYCTDFYNKHGGKPSALVMQLVNELAEKLPDKIIKTLAYSWTIDPPSNMQMRDNVVVMFCATADPHFSIPKGPQAEKLNKMLKGWQEISKHIAVYLYPFPHSNYLFPSPSIYPGAESIAWASDSGISDLYAQISGFGESYGSEAVDLRGWVYARMMWDPSSDPKALVREFCRDNYTKAAADVLEVIELLHSPKWKKDIPADQKSFMLPAYVDPQGVSKANAALERAYARFGEGDKDAKERFERFWIGYLWADVWSNFEGFGKYNDDNATWSIPMTNTQQSHARAKMAKSFMVKYGYNGIWEHAKLNPSQLSIDKFGLECPSAKLSDSRASLVVVPDVAGHITEWIDKNNGFTPLKDAWGLTLIQYPLFSAWRDQIKNAYVSNYQMVSKSDTQVELKGSVAGAQVTKTVTLKDGTVALDIAHAGGEQILSTIMLDLNEEVFSTTPLLCVLKNDGSVTEIHPDAGLGDFWYTAATLDTSDSPGKFALLDGTRKRGILFEWDPDTMEKVNTEYDRYYHPHKLGNMMQISFYSKPGNNLNVKAKIINDSEVSWLK